MRLGGIDNFEVGGHSGSSHQVTNCLHNHDTNKKEMGAMRASSSAFSNTVNAAETPQELTLMELLRNAMAGGKRLWGRIWGMETGGDAVVGTRDQTDGAKERTAGTNPIVTLHDEAGHDTDHGAKIAAASAAVPQPMTRASENPYFTTHSDSGLAKERMAERMRVKFRDMAGRMGRRFGGRFGERLAGRFSGRNALNAGDRKPKEDLRKHSRYKGEDDEIDCVLTDDSYLLDSYDRRGEYTTLTTKDKR